MVLLVFTGQTGEESRTMTILGWQECLASLIGSAVNQDGRSASMHGFSVLSWPSWSSFDFLWHPCQFPFRCGLTAREVGVGRVGVSMWADFSKSWTWKIIFLWVLMSLLQRTAPNGPSQQQCIRQGRRMTVFVLWRVEIISGHALVA